MKKLIALLLITGLFCTCKKDEQQINLTGAWCTLVPIEMYYFTDDSRFTQAARPGEQWIYEQRGGEIMLFGNPNRTWKILYALEDEFRVVESEKDTLTLFRK